MNSAKYYLVEEPANLLLLGLGKCLVGQVVVCAVIALGLVAEESADKTTNEALTGAAVTVSDDWEDIQDGLGRS